MGKNLRASAVRKTDRKSRVFELQGRSSGPGPFLFALVFLMRDLRLTYTSGITVSGEQRPTETIQVRPPRPRQSLIFHC